MNVALFLEIRNEYTEHLVDTLTSPIYDGLMDMYKNAKLDCEKGGKPDLTLIVFQKYLKSINTWSQTIIEDETLRIKNTSNASEYLDDLIKAVIKSNIILLTYSNTISNLIGQTFYNNCTTANFIHKCYIECGKHAYNNPFLFSDQHTPMEQKRNYVIINKNIQEGIVKAVRNILPISMILKEYLINSCNIIQEPINNQFMGSGFPNDMNQMQMNNQVGSFNNFNPGNNNNNMNTGFTFGMNSGPIAYTQNTRPDFNQGVQKNPSENKIISEKKLKLEKEVLNLIKSESIKPNNEKIQAIMNLEKMAAGNMNEPFGSNKETNPEPMNGINPRGYSPKDNLLMNNPSMKHHPYMRNSDLGIAPHLIEKEYGEENKNNTDQRIMNINFDDEKTINTNFSKKTISGTTLSTRPMPYINLEKRSNPETSERIDPDNIQLIEDYGVAQYGGFRNKHNMKKNTFKFQ
uniref:Uncharacterized protein n=1 Tax=Moumouvirus sp. 'Monve' TaxID=1128131 RepID=H2EEI5_9VIRU|nr:hypothetical protein mv_L603 [Moumouvirus Monve]